MNFDIFREKVTNYINQSNKPFKWVDITDIEMYKFWVMYCVIEDYKNEKINRKFNREDF